MSLFNKPGLLGINARNLLYIKPFNKDKAILLADDKLKTKAFLSARGIPVPKLYGTIASIENLLKFDFKKLPESFVLKPNLGFGGEGIIPVSKKTATHWTSINNKKHTIKSIQNHIVDILDGRFSISHLSDTAFFEQLMSADEILGEYAHGGLPDIRIIVHNLIPVMGMLRLPTKESDGKANLHQGAIGVGINIGTGETTHATYRNKIITQIPGIGKIRGIKIPHWDKILSIASQAQLATNLGYLAADIAIDRNLGPILLEINARAGLSIQIANLVPLQKRLERINGLKIRTIAKGIRIGKEMFGKVPEKTTQSNMEKKIVGIEEEVEIIIKDQLQKTPAFLNTGVERSVIDEGFALEKHLLDDQETYDDEKSTVKLKITLGGKRIQSIFDVEKIENGKYKMILGYRDLGDNFLIDPSKKVSHIKNGIPLIKTQIDYKEIDEQLANIDNKIKLLYYLRPINQEEEKRKFFKDFSYNPKFQYPRLEYNASALKKVLRTLIFDDSPTGILLNKKSKEITRKIELHESRGKESFTYSSIELFGKPSKELKGMANEILKVKYKQEEDVTEIDAEEAKKIFTQVLEKYKLTQWKVKIKKQMVANCIAGKNSHLFIKADAKFSKDRINNLIIHEIETHVITAENGKKQPFKLFNRGFGDYLSTQEGLALYNVKTQGYETEFDRLYKAALVRATELGFQLSFSELFLKLLDMGLSQTRAYRICIKLKRGLENTEKPGVFTKDYLYFAGEKEIEQFVSEGGKLEDLYLGKFNIQDLEYIKKIPGLVEATHLPQWINMASPKL